MRLLFALVKSDSSLTTSSFPLPLVETFLRKIWQNSWPRTLKKELRNFLTEGLEKHRSPEPSSSCGRIGISGGQEASLRQASPGTSLDELFWRTVLYVERLQETVNVHIHSLGRPAQAHIPLKMAILEMRLFAWNIDFVHVPYHVVLNHVQFALLHRLKTRSSNFPLPTPVQRCCQEGMR